MALNVTITPLGENEIGLVRPEAKSSTDVRLSSFEQDGINSTQLQGLPVSSVDQNEEMLLDVIEKLKAILKRNKDSRLNDLPVLENSRPSINKLDANDSVGDEDKISVEENSKLELAANLAINLPYQSYQDLELSEQKLEKDRHSECIELFEDNHDPRIHGDRYVDFAKQFVVDCDFRRDAGHDPCESTSRDDYYDPRRQGDGSRGQDNSHGIHDNDEGNYELSCRFSPGNPFDQGGMSEINRHPIVDNHSPVVNQYSFIQNHYDPRDFNYHHHQPCERGPQSPTISREHSSMSEVIPDVKIVFHNPRAVYEGSGRVRQVCFDPGDFNCHQNQQHGRGPTFPANNLGPNKLPDAISVVKSCFHNQVAHEGSGKVRQVYFKTPKSKKPSPVPPDRYIFDTSELQNTLPPRLVITLHPSLHSRADWGGQLFDLDKSGLARPVKRCVRESQCFFLLIFVT